MSKPPIINCHTHIFTGDHVPPWLARTFVPCPFYFLLPLSGVVALLRWWYRGPARFWHSSLYKKMEKNLYTTRVYISRNRLLNGITTLFGVYVVVNVFFFLYDSITHFSAPSAEIEGKITTAGNYLKGWGIIKDDPNVPLMLFYSLLVLLFFKWGRNLILFVFKRLWKFMGMLPGRQTRELLKRYLQIGRFNRYEDQSGIFGKLRGQYPKDTGFVILPMDMRFMGAGKVKEEIKSQMEDLVKIKENHPQICFPFIFADPRRMKDETYFKYSVDPEGKVILSPECLMGSLLGSGKISGIKIYPALGYYPFDELLLPLWKFAVQESLPVMTHCIKGTIFFRGKKDKDWDKHKLFQQSMGKNAAPNGLEDDNDDKMALVPLLLPERKNIDFQANFTHPLNYLCLLDESLLCSIVGQSGNENIKLMFGFNSKTGAISRNLQTLKICFGHFGGDDEWLKFMERDRDNYSSQLLKNPNRGIEFLYNNNSATKEARPGKPEQIWRYADWYSIICSLLLQYPNTYADISYILHSQDILPLLKQTLQNPLLRTRVLYGSDFYVVRNHKSDKEMLADMMGGLNEKDFDVIARTNPRAFLNLPPIPIVYDQL